MNFYTLLTNVGQAKIANAASLGQKVEFQEIALGDSNGSYYEPTAEQTSLANERWRGNIQKVDTDTQNPNWIVIESVILAQDGGFTIREAGIFDKDGDLIAIAKYPETYKPVLEEGSTKDVYIRMILEVTNTGVVELKVDPSVILVNRKEFNEHLNSDKPHLIHDEDNGKTYRYGYRYKDGGKQLIYEEVI